jgi:hypothetical protein
MTPRRCGGLVTPRGFEPPTNGLGNHCSIRAELRGQRQRPHCTTSAGETDRAAANLPREEAAAGAAARLRVATARAPEAAEPADADAEAGPADVASYAKTCVQSLRQNTGQEFARLRPMRRLVFACSLFASTLCIAARLDLETLRATAGACVPAVISGCDVEIYGTLESGDCLFDDGTRFDTFDFEGSAGQLVNIMVRPLSASYTKPFIALVSPAGDVSQPPSSTAARAARRSGISSAARGAGGSPSAPMTSSAPATTSCTSPARRARRIRSSRASRRSCCAGRKESGTSPATAAASPRRTKPTHRGGSTACRATS